MRLPQIPSPRPRSTLRDSPPVGSAPPARGLGWEPGATSTPKPPASGQPRPQAWARVGRGSWEPVSPRFGADDATAGGGAEGETRTQLGSCVQSGERVSVGPDLTWTETWERVASCCPDCGEAETATRGWRPRWDPPQGERAGCDWRRGGGGGRRPPMPRGRAPAPHSPSSTPLSPGPSPQPHRRLGPAGL